MAFEEKLRNVGLMRAENGYDLNIVCTSDAAQESFWQQHLEGTKGKVTPLNSTVLAVCEDWPGGAGNFLGTLYAWRKACLKLAEQGRDLAKELQQGASVAIFHTAGKGTRLAPLPGAENNNKPGVKLPVPGGASILESVIRQTGAYAASRKARLSVFWGDQVFVPSVSAEYTARHHVDIICGLGPMPSAQEWQERGLQRYGLIAAKADGSVVAMLEKVTHAEASEQLTGLEGVELVGTSLGSFSLSAAIVTAMCAGFEEELTKREGKMDSDPHVWMPVTLQRESYVALAVKKGLFDAEGAGAHHDRVSALVKNFELGDKGLFGTVGVGLELSWWDYGMLKLYAQNSLLLTEATEDARLARAFYGVPEEGRVAASQANCSVDAASVVSGCEIKGGTISGSSLLNVKAGEVTATSAVLVNSCARKIVAARGAVAYNVVDDSEEGIVLKEDEVRVGVFTGSGYFEMRSNVAEMDGGKVFKEKVCGNKYSFQEVYDLNQGVDVTACAKAAAAAREAFSL